MNTPKTTLVYLLLTFTAVFLLTGCSVSGGTTTDTESPITETETNAMYTETQPVSQQQTTAETERETESPTAEEAAREILSQMTLKEQIYQLFIVRPEQITGASLQTAFTEDDARAFQTHPVGGIVYFADNLQTPAQVKEMIAQSQALSKLGLFTAVDEEGGSVARIGNNKSMGTTAFPSMKQIGNTADAERAYHVGYTIGTEIKALGFNLDFAPVADVDSNPKNPVIGDRAFSSDPYVTSDMVVAAVRGFHDGGILCTLKHFPGHGDTASDSHYGYAEVDKSLDELRAVELVPFAGGIAAGADLVMLGHISVPQITGNHTPASLSEEVVFLLREELHFDGLIITDAMEMGAITKEYSTAAAAVMAISAGVDILLMPQNLEEAADGIYQAVEDGRITHDCIAESVLRILETKINAGIIVP